MQTLERLSGRLAEGGRARQAVAFLAVAASAAFLFLFVDLTPEVGSEFFFASDDPQLQEHQEIERAFPERPQVLVSAAAPDIGAPEYLARLARLARELIEVEGVLNVRSIHHGPDDVEDAFENPLWRRLLVAEDGGATNLVLLLHDAEFEPVVSRVEEVLDRHEAADLRLVLSVILGTAIALAIALLAFPRLARWTTRWAEGSA